MSNITVLGIDLAKDIFQVCAEDNEGNQLFNRRYKRNQFRNFIKKLAGPCLVGMEACGSAHYWGRELQALGHQVKLINPKKVKAYVDRNKNDAKDAEAICEAMKSKRIFNIPVKSVSQQHITALHKARSQVVKRRTQLANHLRSQLAEFGMVTKRGHKSLFQLVEKVMAENPDNLQHEMLFVLKDLHEEWRSLNKRIAEYNTEVRRLARTNPVAKKLQTVPGIGEITSTALVAKVEDFNGFDKAKDFAAWLGLTPKEHSSAQRRYLGKISKQGDRYIRTLLIHGARAVVSATLRKEQCETAYHRWIHQLVARVGKNKAVVALANKHARMVWALIKHDRELDLNFAEIV